MGFSDSNLDRAQRSQQLDQRRVIGLVYGALRDLVTGSDSAAWVRPDYHTADEVIYLGSRKWVEGSANSDAKKLPRTWRKAMVMAVAQLAIQEIINSQPDDVEVLPAVAYQKNGAARVGILPGGFGLLPPTEEYPEPMLAASMRQGQGLITANIGIWRPSDRTLIVPAGILIIDQLVPTADLTRNYPGVPLA